jgi:pilus assembly protein CpaE
MNRYDKRINITPERVAENLKQEVALSIPLDEPTATKAVNRGVPFVLDNKNQPVSRGVYLLAENLRGRIAAQESGGEADRIGRR